MTVQERIVENLKDAASIASGFSRSLPAEFSPEGLLKEGDVITLPKKYIFNEDGTNTKANVFTSVFNGNETQYITCELTRNGEKSGINFYPSSLTKRIFVSELKDDKVQLVEVTSPEGQVPSHILNFRGKGTEEKTDLHMAMESIAGKSIVITKDVIVKTQKWVDGKAVNQLKDSHKFTYDFK